MGERILKKTIKKFEKERDTYLKFDKSLKALISLITLSSDNNLEVYDKDILIDLLMENIMEGLEDPDIPMSYEGNVYYDLLEKYANMNDRIYKEYKYWNDFDDEKLKELEPDIPLDLPNIEAIKKRYNLVDILIELGKENWIKELLLSDISAHERLSILRNITDHKRKSYGILILSGLSNRLVRNKTKKNVSSKITELRDYLDGSGCEGIIAGYDMDIMYYMQKAGLCDYVKRLRKYGIEQIYSEKYKSNNPLARLCMAIEYINRENDPWNGNYYKRLKVERIIPYIDVRSIYTVIKETDLINHMDVCSGWDIGTSIMTKWDKIYSDESTRPDLYKHIYSDIEKCNEMLSNMIKHSKGVQDYNDKRRFAKELLSVINKENIIARYKQKDKEALMQKQELSTKRKELLTLLSNLNDSLQEQVPGKRIIKEIDFKKES